ncbi:hypothetical protein HKD37_13G035480 [Glycine soja]
MQSAKKKIPPTPKALVICFTRNVTSSRSEYPPTVPKPMPFSYQSNKVVPWKYTPPAFGEGAATKVDSLSAKVTNITGLSGVTRSGRVFAPPHSVELPFKGKAPMIQEPADAATPSKEVDPRVVKEVEKKEGIQGKAVTLEKAHEFLRLIQQSEFKVVEQLNKTPARISLLELLISSEPHRALLNSTADSICEDRFFEDPNNEGLIIDFDREEMAPRKLSAKRSRRDAAAEGTSAALEFDNHRFRSAEHQQRFEAIKGWSFHRERRVQLKDDEYTDFQEEIARRRWTSLVTPMAKFDPDIVLEFCANAWPTEEGVRDMRSGVRGQWIPFDADALSQFLGDPLVLEEGQE